MKAWSVMTLALAVACAPTHIAPYQPRKREYQLPTPSAKDEAVASAGSLWAEGRPASMLFTDARAFRENDLVVVRVEEIADARRNADTDLSRSSETAAKIEAFLELVSGARNLDSKLDASGSVKTRFAGKAGSSRSERLTATVPALVRKVLPNGNLFVEGHRVVLVNAEEHHFYISGVVRPIDIDQDNSVKSSMIADAQIEFTGRGDMSDTQRQGWFSRLLSWMWPF